MPVFLHEVIGVLTRLNTEKAKRGQSGDFSDSESFTAVVFLDDLRSDLAAKDSFLDWCDRPLSLQYCYGPYRWLALVVWFAQMGQRFW